VTDLLQDLSLSDPRWPWAPAVVGVAVLALLCAAVGRRPRRGGSDLLLAHTARMRSLPRYRVLVARRRVAGLLAMGAALLVVAGSALVLARPQAQSVEVRAERGRDIVLCLDASASMDAANVAVVREVRRIVSGLRGDRVGMVIWSGAAVQVFPLTDDYGYVASELDRAEEAFSGESAYDFYAGVDLAIERGSIIGDGIVSCVDRFDPSAPDRTRAVIVSSDNDPLGTPAYSLPDAANYAARHQVLVYGIGAASLDRPDRSAAKDEMAAVSARTGGTFAILDTSGGAQRIVDRIDDLEKARSTEPPRTVSRDTPYSGVVISCIGVGCLLVSWGVSWWGRRRRASGRAP
jgi:Ca-activated chloride channel family protein